MQPTPGRFRRRRRMTGVATVMGSLTLLGACEGAPDTEQGVGTMEGVDPMEATSRQGSVAYAPEFTAEGELRLPRHPVWREWPQVGTPLTPNALNDGEAPFPEFHSVYIDPVSWEHWRDTGEFRDGTVLAKELVSVYSVDAMPDGSTQQVSGRGYFMGDFVGFEIAYKSSEHFSDQPGNWAYFSFGHHPPPYLPSTPPMPVEQCSACHQGSAAQDFVFTQFYPVLRAAKGPPSASAARD